MESDMTIKVSSADLGQDVHSRRWETRFDEGTAPRGRIGFVLISTDRLIEDDVVKMLPKGVAAHFSRARLDREINVANLSAMLSHLAESAALILPGEDLDRPAVICYACTSGSVVMGEDRVVAELLRGAPDSQATTLISGVIQGLKAVGARRIVVGTPYLDEVNTIEKAYLEQQGFEVLDIQGLNLTYDTEIVRVTPEFIVEFATALDRPDADAIFLSCGALRSIEVIDQIEKITGKPVIVSNQAMTWHCLRMAGIKDEIPGYGQLFLKQ